MAYRRVWVRQFLRGPVLVPVPVSVLVPVPALVTAPVAAALVTRGPGRLLDDRVHAISSHLPHIRASVKHHTSHAHTDKSKRLDATTKETPHDSKDDRKHTDFMFLDSPIKNLRETHLCVSFHPSDVCVYLGIKSECSWWWVVVQFSHKKFKIMHLVPTLSIHWTEEEKRRLWKSLFLGDI